ncbi:hypothetical protein [Marinomonas transparens]|uniref:Uncharacterized protein n=1 Tax=Marinomonas transparens TaxID=2795388 RepID=A0A934N6S2_9GAMM|nr:hypothetical protein [Marinomonas transparens]MBJ7538331.1 hypothetical protein [Marinomonas transparens]
MYKINHKAIMFVFLLQLLAGAVWYYLAPTFLVGATIFTLDKSHMMMALLFAFSALVYLYFIAWLLVRIKWFSSFGMIMLVIGIWLFAVLPNYAFISLHFNLSGADSIYLLSYSAVNTAIAALILPLWRSSRSIFKTQ